MRGYHVFVFGQMFKDDMKTGRPDILKASAGCWRFPDFARSFGSSSRTRAADFGGKRVKDSWAMHAQIHLSL